MANPTKSKARLDKAALFDTLGYVPHAGQLEVHRSKAKRRIVGCGTRWGKTTLAVHEAIAYLLEPRDRALGWLIAPTYELTSRIFDRVVEILHRCMPHRVVSFDHRAHSIVVANLGGGHSELRARSADRPAGLLGDAVDFLLVDECTKVRDDVWDGYIAPRLVDRHGSALLLSTPTTTDSWFFKQWKRGRRDPEYQSFAMPTTSNPHIPAELVEAERGRLDSETFAMQYEARFDGIDIEVCDTCKGPDRYASAMVSLWGDEQPKLCPDCHRIVGDDGLTRVALEDGKMCTTVIIRWVRPRDPEVAVPGGPRDVTSINAGPGVELRQIVLQPSPPNPQELPPGCE